MGTVVTKNYTFVNLNLAIEQDIEPFLEEDNNVYCLNKKPKLLRRFIAYRVSSFILMQVERNKRSKLIFYLDRDIKLKFAKDYELFFLNTLRNLAKLLGICLFINDIKLETFLDILPQTTGEGREAKSRLHATISRTSKISSLDNFYKYLSKNGIYKIQDKINNSLQLKLGLFVT
ncbi:hypothetical protein EBR43_12945 [bacterium]|nr:hypothetical protein [bacterium]